MRDREQENHWTRLKRSWLVKYWQVAKAIIDPAQAAEAEQHLRDIPRLLPSQVDRELCVFQEVFATLRARARVNGSITP
ncbi:MAG: hypothetical protein ACYC0Y_25570 [Pirellulales bacterium]